MIITALSFYKFKRIVQIFVLLPVVIIISIEFFILTFNKVEKDWMYIPILIFFGVYGLLRFLNGLLSFVTKQYFATKTKMNFNSLKNFRDNQNYIELKGSRAIVLGMIDIAVSFVCIFAITIILRHIF